MASPDRSRSKGELVERNPDGSLTKETLKRAMKAFRKRLKLARLDQESRLGGDALTRGQKSAIVAVRPPEQYPQEVWDRLVELGRLESVGQGLYAVVEQG